MPEYNIGTRDTRATNRTTGPCNNCEGYYHVLHQFNGLMYCISCYRHFKKLADYNRWMVSETIHNFTFNGRGNN